MFTTLALNMLFLAYPVPREREPSDKGLGYLGVTFESADANGIQIIEIRRDGPAVRAGLRADDIIRKFNGEPVNFESFPKKIIRIRPGTVVPLEVHRGTEILTIKIKIGVRPEDFPYELPDPINLPPPNDSLPPLPVEPLPKK